MLKSVFEYNSDHNFVTIINATKILAKYFDYNTAFTERLHSKKQSCNNPLFFYQSPSNHNTF